MAGEPKAAKEQTREALDPDTKTLRAFECEPHNF
jgi:hypothetical protein